MRFRLLRTNQSGGEVVSIKIADAGDVAAIGNGLQVGEVLVRHAPVGTTPVPLVEGQTVWLNDACGPYAGSWHAIRYITAHNPVFYTVIDAPNYGAVTPTTPGIIRVWLNKHTFFLRLAVYTSPTGTPQYVDLDALPNAAGIAEFDVSNYIRDYFRTDNLNVYALGVGGSEIVQNAHGITSLFYKVRIAEAYEQPDGSIVDPFDGTHDILVDTEFRVAVNARHPYEDWNTADMGKYVVGSINHARKFLTEAPRDPFNGAGAMHLTLGASDRFRVHMLTNHQTQSGNDPWKVGYKLRIYPVTGTTVGTLLLDKAITLTPITSSFSVAIGPADLEPYITVPDKYMVYVSDGSNVALSEQVVVTVDRKCAEGAVALAVLNPLGGVDHVTFRGRIIETARGGWASYTASTKPLGKEARRWLASLLFKRGATATVRKPYSVGTGNDWQERAYRGAKAVWRIADDRCCNVIVANDDVVVHTTGPQYKPLTVEFRTGVDQISQMG